MLRTLPQTRDYTLTQRIAAIAFFTALTAVAARVQIPLEPVPFTFQPLAVLLAGMVLGWRDGALSQIAYVALIAVGLPLDANLRGSLALFGPTGGYLIGFIAAAAVAGLLIERGANRLWMRWLAGVAGIAVIYVFGLPVLMAVTGMDFTAAWAAGVAPFIAFDLLKALIAAGLTEGGRALLLRV